MRHIITSSKSFCWLTLVVAISATAALGCGDQSRGVVNTTNQSDNDHRTDADGPTYLERKQNVVMPWTHHLADNLVEQAQIEPDRLIFEAGGPAAEAVADYEHGDVIASANADAPFLRKIESIEHTGDRLIFNTRNAQITEAVYKGSMSAQKPTPATSNQRQGLRQQQLGSTELNYWEGGYTFRPEETPDPEDTNVEINPRVNGAGELVYDAGSFATLKAQPHVDVNAGAYLDLSIDPADGMSTKQYYPLSGTKQCTSSEQCFDDRAEEMDMLAWCSSAGRCKVDYKDDEASTSCDAIIDSLTYARENPRCGEAFKEFYEGDLDLSAFAQSDSDDNPCYHDDWGPWNSHYMPPHPVQADWAKANCRGALKRFVADIKGSVEPSTGEMSIEMKQEFDKSWTLWEAGPKQFMHQLFWIGWLPIYITADAQLALEAKVHAEVVATAKLKPIGVNLSFRDGFHYYASPGDYDNKRVDVGDGTTKPLNFAEEHPGAEETTGDQEAPPIGYDHFHRNPEYESGLSLTGLDFLAPDGGQDITLSASGKATATLSVTPRIRLLLYDLAGPYVEPFSPYGQFQFSAEGQASFGGGFEAIGGACGNSAASMCVRAGAKGEMGMDAENICDGCSLAPIPLYDSCSDFCPSNEESFCAKECFGTTEPDPEPEPAEPLKISLTWYSDQLDMDLKMTSPYFIDFNDQGTGEGGFVHSGDVRAGGTTDENGNYTEYLEVVEPDLMPASGTTIELDVKTWRAYAGGLTFDLVVTQNGNTIESWEGVSAGVQGDVRSYSFQIP